MLDFQKEQAWRQYERVGGAPPKDLLNLVQVDKLFCIITPFLKVVCSRSIMVVIKYPFSLQACFEIHITYYHFLF